jgi:Uma2 family endonuclease
MTVIDMPKTVPPRVKRWTKREFYALVEKGEFQRPRVSLFRGELYEMSAVGALHERALMGVSNWMYRNFDPAFQVRIQMSMNVPGETINEPDAAVVTHEQLVPMPYPQCAELVVEVSDSSLDFDHEKAMEYAAARVPEYWIVDVMTKKLEVFREPVADASTPLGFRYASHRILTDAETVSPLVRPEAAVAVKKLLGLL